MLALQLWPPAMPHRLLTTLVVAVATPTWMLNHQQQLPRDRQRDRA